VDYRLRHLIANKRGTECLKAAADKRGGRTDRSSAGLTGNIARGARRRGNAAGQRLLRGRRRR
jgi:hypothetical protein